MIRGLYAAATGLQAASEQHEVTAYNLANASVPGFRQRGTITETFDRVLGRAQAATGDVVGTRVAGVYHDFRPGSVHQTNNPYDLALAEPDQFFTIDGPNGPLYTRNGAFRITPQGRVVSSAGYPLRGADGPVAVPPDTLHVDIASDGTVMADGVDVARIQPVRFNDLKQLTAVGPTLYAAGTGAGPTSATGRVMQGYREGSNVDPADAMVKMLIGARYYDAAQRSLRTISDSIQLNTRPSA